LEAVGMVRASVRWLNCRMAQTSNALLSFVEIACSDCLWRRCSSH